jgi:hypothetical protein
MANNGNKLWVVCLKSKKEPIRVEAASVKRVNDQYVFTDDSGADAGLYDVCAVEGYSVEPVAPGSRVFVTIETTGAPVAEAPTYDAQADHSHVPNPSSVSAIRTARKPGSLIART